MALSTTIQNSEDLSLSVAEILSYRMAGGAPGRQQPIVIDIRNIILKITLDEDIYEHSMVGKIQIYDTADVRTILPITGLERLNLKFNTQVLLALMLLLTKVIHFTFIKYKQLLKIKILYVVKYMTSFFVQENLILIICVGLVRLMKVQLN